MIKKHQAGGFAGVKRPRQRSHRRSGFSLLEVLVALVIFVVGALSIVRIFPGSLAAVQNSGDRLVATTLDTSTLNTFQYQPGLVPAAVYEADNNGWKDFDGAVVGTSNSNNSLPAELSDTAFNNSALGHLRRITGERHTVQIAAPPLSAPPTALSEPFVLTQYPYQDYVSTQVFIEDQVNGVTINKEGDLDFTDASLESDGSDFSNSNPAFPTRPPGTHRSGYTSGTPVNDITYYVSYRWKEVFAGGDEHTNGVVDEPKYLGTDAALAPQDYNARMLAGKKTKSANMVVPGAVSVRFRKLMPPPPPLSIVLPRDPVDPDRGYLPIYGANAGETVSIDYTVRDWRLLVDDNQLTVKPTGPSRASDFEVALPVAYLSEQSPPAPPASSVPPVPLVVTLMMTPNLNDPNPNNRSQTQLFRAQWDTSGAQPMSSGPERDTLVGVTPKTSKIIFNASDPSGPLFTPHVRTVYRTLDGWARQLSVAAQSYIPFPDGPFAPTATNLDSNLIADPSVTDPNGRPEPWREYIMAPAGRGVEEADLYFHPSEAGKAIRVSFEYQVQRPGPPTFRSISGAVVTIAKTTVPAPTSGDQAKFAFAVGGSGNVSVASLTDERGNPVTPTAILSVEGLSVQTRTAWLNGDRYTQETVMGYRSLKK